MTKKTTTTVKKTKANKKTAENAENTTSDVTETLLTETPVEPVNVPQIETGEVLQKQEPEKVPPEPDPEPGTDPEPDTDPELDTDPEPTAEPEPEVEAVLQTGQCPRCKNINKNKNAVFPGVRTVVAPVFYEGVQYQVVRIRTTKCEKCGQKFCLREYLPKIKNR
jgi:hypothetical protein